MVWLAKYFHLKTLQKMYKDDFWQNLDDDYLRKLRHKLFYKETLTWLVVDYYMHIQYKDDFWEVLDDIFYEFIF